MTLVIMAIMLTTLVIPTLVIKRLVINESPWQGLVMYKRRLG